MVSAADALERLRRVVVAGVEFERLLVVLDRLRRVAGRHIRLGEAVVGVEGLWMRGDVETEDQLKQLISLGCEEAQGYLLSHPVESSVASELVAAGKPLF